MIRGSNPVWSFVDLTGKQFDDTFWMYVLENEIPYIPATVWHDPEGNVPWDNPIQFLANGTLPIDIYWDPDVIYRLEFRHNISGTPTQNDPLIYLVENYTPGEGGTPPVDVVSLDTDNQVTNPQFSLVNFVSPLTLTNANTQTIEFAPGWFLDLTGSSANVTLRKVPLNNSPSTINPTNAPYAIQIDLGDWDSATLRQRFDQNGMLWANKVVSSSITARIDGATKAIRAVIRDSNGISTEVLESTALSGTFEEYTGLGRLPATSNPDVPPAAYIEYRLDLPPNGNYFLTSIQLVAQNDEIEIGFEQDTIERQIDHTFHYYKEPLEYKPIPSYLVGWDFILNPAQLGDTFIPQAIGANKSYYTWDNTIVFQSADSGITVAREATAGLFEMVAATDTQMAVVQYVVGTECQNLLTELIVGGVSVNTEMASTVAQTLTISLWWTADSTLPNVASGTNNSLVATLDPNGKPATLHGNWTEITRTNLGNATFESTNVTSLANFGFAGFFDNTAYLTGKFLAIVVGTDIVSMNNAVEFRSISIVPGQVPTIPAPKTQDEVLRECQRTFETTFIAGATVPSAVTTGQLIAPMTATTTTPSNIYANTFGGEFQVPKWSTPNVVFYSGTSTTASRVQSFGIGSGSVGTAENDIATVFNTPIIDTKTYRLTSLGNASSAMVTGVANATPTRLPAAWIQYHYTADARPGIVLS